MTVTVSTSFKNVFHYFCSTFDSVALANFRQVDCRINVLISIQSISKLLNDSVLVGFVMCILSLFGK